MQNNLLLDDKRHTHTHTLSVETHTFYSFFNIYQNHNTVLIPEEMMLHVGNPLVLIQHFYTLALYTTCVIHTSTFPYISGLSD